MNKTISGFRGARLVLSSLLSLTLTLVLLSLWSAVAFAETSRFGQYHDPTASGEAAIAASGGHSSGSPLVAAGEDDPSSASASGVLPLTGLLPDTGGPLLPLLALAIFASSFAGLLALRRLNL
jgi:hypothetical protein